MNVKVAPSGIFINPEMPYLGGTPDGTFQLNGRRCLLEVKCPYTGRNDTISPGENFPFLEWSQGTMRLKRSHSYFYQVMGQMYTAKCRQSVFVVYTHEELFKEEISYDEDFFWVNMYPHLRYFHECIYKPFIAQKL